ncbi:hypothetical protein EVU94_01655 [Flavobacteriaceae bacterium 144Ye]|nr:hypothetical protein EVU94_01655 [Flavobacteriaceae bacterium 144Ye]
MGFGGSAQSMITILKNNEKMRNRRDKFKKTLGGYDNKRKTEYDFPEATPEVLKEIKERLIKERKQRFIKIAILFTILLSLFIYFIVR